MTTWMSRMLGMALLAWMAGCALQPPMPPNDALFDDALFAPPREPIEAAPVLALSPAMRAYLEREILPAARLKEPRRALLDALYASHRLQLRYDGTLTRTAAEAFEARAGNCMSLVLMTGAFAREMGLQVRYQSVYLAPAWGRRGSLQFSMGHINVAVGRPLLHRHDSVDQSDWLTVDFLPQGELGRQRHAVIHEPTLVAMFMNNKAVEALAAGRVDDAYWYTRAALAKDRELLFVYNTLAVVYQRRGKGAQAERVLRFALAREPDNTHAMNNLAQLLIGQGRQADAQVLLDQLARLEPEPPFKYFDQGRAAMDEGDYRRARRMFERELDRDPSFAESHFWLAQALYRLGELDKAARHLAAARDNSTTVADQALYAAKLSRLKAEQVH